MTTDLPGEADRPADGDAADRPAYRRPAAALAGYAERHKRREVRQVVREFDGDVSADQYRILATMADAIADEVLAGPRRRLRAAAADGDRATVAAGLGLFGLADDGGGRPSNARDSSTGKGAHRGTVPDLTPRGREVEHDV